jgi:hypothetical protein
VSESSGVVPATEEDLARDIPDGFAIGSPVRPAPDDTLQPSDDGEPDADEEERRAAASPARRNEEQDSFVGPSDALTLLTGSALFLLSTLTP